MEFLLRDEPADAASSSLWKVVLVVVGIVIVGYPDLAPARLIFEVRAAGRATDNASRRCGPPGCASACSRTRTFSPYRLPPTTGPAIRGRSTPKATGTSSASQKSTAVKQVTRCVERGFDVFFNLCDGAADQDTPGIEVVRTLERHRVAFTGATSEFYEPSRDAMKRACRAEGIAAPEYVLARDEADVERAASRLRYPLFVKHYSSYSSVDLSRHSRVVSPAGARPAGAQDHAPARRGADRGVHRGHRSHRAGRGESRRSGAAQDLHADSVPLSRRRDLQALGDEVGRLRGDGERFPSTIRRSTARLRDVSARLFVALRGASFGRCDLRVDASGTPFMLEINPNCGVYYPPADAGSADLCLLHDPEGHAGFTRRLIRGRRSVRG